MKDHLAGRRSARGLLYMPVLTEDYGGVVRVYESSAAEQPCVWLRVARGSHRPPAGEPPADIAVHLTAETAWELAEQLRYTLRHHYQCDAMPDVAEELKERVERIVTDVRDSDPQGGCNPADIADRLAAAGLLADPHDEGSEWRQCTGAIDCPAGEHVDGCYALEPTEHPSEAGDTY